MKQLLFLLAIMASLNAQAQVPVKRLAEFNGVPMYQTDYSGSWKLWPAPPVSWSNVSGIPAWLLQGNIDSKLDASTYNANRTTDQAATANAQSTANAALNTANAAVPGSTYNANRTTDLAGLAAAQATANNALPTSTYTTNRTTDQAATVNAQNTANAALSTANAAVPASTYTTNRTADQGATTTAQNTANTALTTANAALPIATYNTNRTSDQAATATAQSTANGAQTTANASLPTATYNVNRAADQAAAANPANIVQTPAYRFVTDAEKAGWNAGGSTPLYPNTIFVMTPTAAAIQSAINSATAVNTTVILGFTSCTFVSGALLDISNKTNFTLDLNGARLYAYNTRTMIYCGGTSKNIRICNGGIFNMSPTITTEYFATISSVENAIIDGWEIDHIEGTTPNADQNFMLCSTYRDVPANPGGTSIIRGLNFHDNYIHHVGRMGLEIINGGVSYGDLTIRHYDTRFTNNRLEFLGLQSSGEYGMGISLDGPGEGAVIAHNTIRNARRAGIEIVNGKNMSVVNNTVVDDAQSALNGCNGISITDNRRFLTTKITVAGNVVDTKQRAINIREASYLTVTGNQFRSKLGNDLICKKSTFAGNTFESWAPTEPVLVLGYTADAGNTWTATENLFSNNTVTNCNPSKPSGYTGPYQLMRLTGGAMYNIINGNYLVRDPAATSFPYIEYTNGSTSTNNTFGTNYQRDGRSLGYGDL